MNNDRFVRETYSSILREAMARAANGTPAINDLVDRCVDASFEVPRFFATELVGEVEYPLYDYIDLDELDGNVRAVCSPGATQVRVYERYNVQGDVAFVGSLPLTERVPETAIRTLD